MTMQILARQILARQILARQILARQILTLMVPATVALLLLSACTAPQAQDEAANTEVSGTVSATYAFSSPTVGGGTFSGDSLAGKPAVLWFWSPWCPTCRAQSPGVTRLAEKYAGRVNVIGVGGLDEAEAIREYGTQVDAIVQLVDVDGVVWRHFGVTAQSTYVVIDAGGNVVSEGYLDEAVLDETVAELVS